MFFLMFFLFTPSVAGKFKLQKDHFVFDVTKAEEIQKSASTELHEWSENVENVENCNFLNVNCKFLLVIWVKRKQPVCSITLLILVFFTACSYHFLFRRYSNSSMTCFSSEIVLPFPNSIDLNNRAQFPMKVFEIVGLTRFNLVFLLANSSVIITRLIPGLHSPKAKSS